jgi:hypothetical protein
MLRFSGGWKNDLSSSLRQLGKRNGVLEAYIALESALGFSLRARERLLRDFVAFVEKSGVTGAISSQIALDWACSASEHCGVSGRAARLGAARRFLSHLSAVVPGIEVPSAALLARPQRPKPFLTSTEEISRLLNAALCQVVRRCER